jgi:hypothetical protein
MRSHTFLFGSIFSQSQQMPVKQFCIDQAKSKQKDRLILYEAVFLFHSPAPTGFLIKHIDFFVSYAG